MPRYRMKKPALVPLLFIITATLLLTGLGLWQLERLHRKEALIARIEAAQAESVVTALPDNPAASAALEYRHALLSGRLMTGKGLRFIGRKSSGYVWLVPMELTQGGAVLVSFGWLPEGEEPQTQAQASIEIMQGILRPLRQRRMFSPDNQPARNLWFTEDLAPMQEATGLTLLPLVLEADALPTLRNDHLGYALTWFALALAGIVMFLIYHREPTTHGKE